MKVCEKMKKVTIRTSGFALVLFGFIGALIVYAISIFVLEVINRFNLIDVFALICFILFFCYVFIYIVGNRIELTDKSMIIKVWKNEMFPTLDKIAAQEKVIELNDLEVIYLGRLGYLREIIMEKFKNDPLGMTKELDMIRNLENGFSKYVRRNIGFKYIPFMIIYCRSGEKILVSTKPYSKKSFSELLNQIKKMNIEIIVEKGII